MATARQGRQTGRSHDQLVGGDHDTAHTVGAGDSTR